MSLAGRVCVVGGVQRQVEWAYALPAHISAATQIAAMSSGSLEPLCNAAVVWLRMQYGHWVTWATTTAIGCLVFSSSAPGREHLPAELVKRVLDAGSQLLAPMRDLSIGKGIDRPRHGVPRLAHRSLGSLPESTRPTQFGSSGVAALTRVSEGSPRLMTEDCFKRVVASIRSKLHSAVVEAVGGPRWPASL